MTFTPETPYKLTFAFLWIVYFLARLYFQRRVRGQRAYTLMNPRRERVFFFIFAIAFILLPLYFLTPWLGFASLGLPAWLRWVGGLLTLGGITLFGWSHIALGMNWTAVLALAPEQELVQSGPYRRIRHPMYTAFFLVGIGFSLLASNWMVALIYLLPLTVMYITRVGAEEEMMTLRFGQAYLDYKRRTGRLLPYLGALPKA